MILRKEQHERKIQSCKSSFMKKRITHWSNSINLNKVTDSGENCICSLCGTDTALPALFQQFTDLHVLAVLQ